MEKAVIISEILKIIRHHLPRDYKIFLFGSWARGDFLENSDIDIGILGERKVPWEIMAKILDEID
jgi:predicted nucleotidyltransferase